MKNLTFEKFTNIDLTDVFFDTLKEDYPEFEAWFKAKADAGASAYVIRQGGLQGFVYLKIEEESVANIDPPLPHARHLKVGTLKINSHGTKLGQRFVKKIFDNAIAEGAVDIYVTVFPKHQYLIDLLHTYGFKDYGIKQSTLGEELVLVKDFLKWHKNPLENYPMISRSVARPFLLAIYPEFHTKFLPDSKLYGESYDVVKDVSHANSIHKIYISGISATGKLVQGDMLVMYRTNDKKSLARYRSVATSIGVVEEVRKISSFGTETAFLKYVQPYSVYEKSKLQILYATKKRHVVIRFTYNIALSKRLIRDRLIKEVGVSELRRWDFFRLTDEQFEKIVDLGEVDERYFVH
ncbi:hypothetical protein SAMN05216567_13216 [Variovorax sp. OK605]|uniref:N-acetyltransferase n=1 Tax=Variovorax sp. OK605 TaxID=1855317 RepID=UPI0008E53D1F|nr:N-acetyltransferase [Variovorax sp. OK605]SFQ73536.1 hypothetical protein SAMN05216567_13216 [Variovorax sp. OK605]